MNRIVEVESFLKKASIKIEGFKEAKRLYSDLIAPDFFIFDYLRDDEMGLSRCIGNLLNPTGKHAQGASYLNLFISHIQLLLDEQRQNGANEDIDVIKDSKIGNFNWPHIDKNSCKVELEHSTNELRRIDIHLQFNTGEVIGVENKPWAEDQANQLSDYAKYLNKQAINRNWLLIYICNTEPSEQSISTKERKELESQERLLIFSYEYLIRWLQACTNITKAQNVRTFIEELIKFIKKEINGEMDMELANQLSAVIQENLDTAMQVANSIDDVKKSLIAKLKIDLQQKAMQQNYKLQWKSSFDSKWPSYTGFGFNFSKESFCSFEIWFEFAESNLQGFYWGIRKKNKDVKRDVLLWKEINELMTIKFGPSKSTAWWPWWNYFNFESEFKNWEKSSKPWLAIKNDTISEMIITIVTDVNQHFSQCGKLELLKDN